MESTSKYVSLINQFGAKQILVIGDLILDIYLKGMSTRLCPEAPVPVVDVVERTVLLGGAANTVCNLKAVGASVAFATVIGCDTEGDEAIRLLKDLGVAQDSIVRNADRKTITKSRVVAATQVITRIDQGSEEAVDEETSHVLIKAIEEAYKSCDAVIVSDYAKGVITPALIDALITLRKRRPVFIAVDSKRLEFFSPLHPAFAKPNYDEVIKLLGLRAQARERTAQLSSYASVLSGQVNAPLIAVTLDGEGSLIIEDGKLVGVYAAPQVTKPHVSGAGDTYLSAFVLAYISSGNSGVSAEMATAAAAIAVRKEDTSTCSNAELKSYFNIHSKYIPDLGDLKDICDAYRKAGKRIVFTNGCFDILHSGHVTYLHCAKELGDVLIVGLNTDESIQRLKGKSRPINNLADRLQVLAGLSSVDHIVAFGDAFDDTPVPLIQVVQPHVFAKGGDYTKEKLPEADTVEAYGGEIVFLAHIPDHSTTRIINRISQVSKAVTEEIFGHDKLEGM
jgi:D-beta-D-heptose 7-phosphate kinase/D-beta-D-heptose 1-phosphate adenosyltransferase